MPKPIICDVCHEKIENDYFFDADLFVRICPHCLKDYIKQQIDNHYNHELADIFGYVHMPNYGAAQHKPLFPVNGSIS